MHVSGLRNYFYIIRLELHLLFMDCYNLGIIIKPFMYLFEKGQREKEIDNFCPMGHFAHTHNNGCCTGATTPCHPVSAFAGSWNQGARIRIPSQALQYGMQIL